MPHHAAVTEDQVLAVLASAAPGQVAEGHALDPVDLAEAVEVYRAAGRAALERRANDWLQVRIRFSDWDTAEQAATIALGPSLCQAQRDGAITTWWFLRKHPYWRLRLHGPTTSTSALKAAVQPLLDELINTGAADQWTESIYEPETLAFGGPTGMDIAHRLFHADSHGFLHYHHQAASASGREQTVGRRELSVLLSATLLRAARQDEHDQGDVWHRVAQMRPLTSPPPADRLRSMVPNLQRLMTLDTSPTSALFDHDGPLPTAVSWATAFATAGRDLADAARDGHLQRGLRNVLANHVIFHWNRLGMPATTQAVLARAARAALLNPEHGDL